MQLKDSSLLKDQCYIAGEWTGKPVTPVTNPATGEELAKVPDLGADETRRAIEAAKDDLALLMTLEQGKPLGEAQGQVGYGAAFVELYAEEAKRIYGETIPTHRHDGRILVSKEPVGVVGAITPWNFPLAMITRKVAPAIAVGCTVVCKPARETPLSALALAELADRAGFPNGVLNIVTGDAPTIGKELTSNPLVRAIAFTGSTAIGKLLMEQSAGTVKRVWLELGGNAPFIVFDDADLDKAVQGALASKFRNTGQTCVCANRFLVQDGIYDTFAEKLASEVMKMKVGQGTEVGKYCYGRQAASTGRHLLRTDGSHQRNNQDALHHGRDFRSGGGIDPFQDRGRGHSVGERDAVRPRRLFLHPQYGAVLAGVGAT